MLRMIAIALVFLTTLILSACSSTPTSNTQEAKGFVPLAQPLGKGSCEFKGPGFEAPEDAQTCDVFGQDKLFLGRVEVEGGLYHCSIAQGYIRCANAQGQNIRPDMTRLMCPFKGPEPTCSELGN